VLFASLVDDPSAHPDKFPTEEAQKRERDRLFDEILADLVRWENSNKEQVLEKARKEILASTGGNPPPVLDPFCGGGSIPLEAQRLGLQVYASDLNPVAVLITKALVEIPPKFAGHPPVNPEARSLIGGDRNWRAAAGLAEDVRFYGRWMRERAWERIGHLYPTVRLPKEQGGGEAEHLCGAGGGPGRQEGRVSGAPRRSAAGRHGKPERSSLCGLQRAGTVRPRARGGQGRRHGRAVDGHRGRGTRGTVLYGSSTCTLSHSCKRLSDMDTRDGFAAQSSRL
jgi:hypothetical protein